VRAAVGEFVRRMRDAGMPPEVALVAVKTRLVLSVTAATPAAPRSTRRSSSPMRGLWAIKAYYDAA